MDYAIYRRSAARVQGVLDDAVQILVRPTVSGSGSVEVIVDVTGYFE